MSVCVRNAPVWVFYLTHTHTVKWIEAETAKHAAFLSIVANVNLKVHTKHYNDILNGVLFPPANAGNDVQMQGASGGSDA